MARRPSPSVPMTTIISLTGVTALSAVGLLLLVTFHFPQAQASGASSREEYVPVRSVVYRSMSAAASTAEASYEPFEVCEGCRCCAASDSDGGSCVDTSCCYSIDCNLPGKPFGTCAFTPQTCGCGAANNCTQPSS